MQAILTGAKLAAYGMIPARLHADLDLTKWVRLGIDMCPGDRVYQDGLSPVDVLDAVVMLGGLKAEYSGVP